MTTAALATLAVRYLLVMLFLPFSALDEIMNFRGAVTQAPGVAPGGVAVALVLAGLSIRSRRPIPTARSPRHDRLQPEAATMIKGLWRS